MKKTTPPIGFDIEKLLPNLTGKAKETLRLHPRRKAGLEPTRSKIGGSIVWPAEVTRPICSEHGREFIPILQLAGSDVPSVQFPGCTDLFQLFWCPNDHVDCGYCPSLKLFWHNLSSMTERVVIPPIARPTGIRGDYYPFECELNPEAVYEYPPIETLPDSDRDILRHWKQDGAYLYQCCYSVAPGFKIGGYPNWCQGPEIPHASNGVPMEFFLTLDSQEYDPVSIHRWLPEEERHLVPSDRSIIVEYPDGGSMHTSRDLTPEEAAVWTPERYEQVRALQAPADLMIGDGGQINVFLDKSTTPWAHRGVMQCS